METQRTEAGGAAETSGLYPDPGDERLWGPSLEVGLGYARLNDGSNHADSYGLELSAGMWSKFPPSLKLRVSFFGEFQRLRGSPFRENAKDPNPDLLSMGLRTGFIWSATEALDLGLNLTGGSSFFSGMSGSGFYAEGGLLGCILKDRLCLEGALRAYALVYQGKPENFPGFLYPLPQNEFSRGFAGVLRATSYWDF